MTSAGPPTVFDRQGHKIQFKIVIKSLGVIHTCPNYIPKPVAAAYRPLHVVILV
jgi:hypothetical protein